MNSTTGDIATSAPQCFCVNKVTPEEIRVTSTDEVFIVWLMSQHRKTFALLISQETHTLCVFDQLPVVSWRRAKYKQMYGLKSTLTVSR